jgi:glycosyltransferase involved in cell wall biosynthesis
MPELIGASRAVRLVPAEDSGALADALREVLADPAARAVMSREARDLFRREFHLDAWIADVLELIDSAAREAGLAPASRLAPLPG